MKLYCREDVQIKGWLDKVCVSEDEKEREKRDEEVNTSGVAGKIDEVRVKKRNCRGKVSGDCKQ